MARKQSLRDLAIKARNLRNRPDISDARRAMVDRIYRRYADNIDSTKTMQNAFRKFFAYKDGRYLDAANNRKFSRNTYMGLSNG